MAQRLSEETKNQILEHKLLGLSNREVAAKVGTSAGTVSNVIDDFSANVEDPISTFEFVSTLRKHGIKSSDLVSISHLYSKLQRFGLDEDLAKFLQDVYPRCKEMGLEPKELIDLAKSTFDLQSSVGLKTEEISQYCNKLGKQVLQLNQEIETLENKKKTAQKILDSALATNNTTIQALGNYQSLKEDLRRVGVDISDVQQLSSMLTQAKEDNFEIKQIREYLSEQRGIKKYTDRLHVNSANLNSEIKSMEKQLSDMSTKLKSDTAKYSHLSKLFQIFDELSDKGINPTAISHWNDIVTSSGLSTKDLLQAIDKFGNLKNALETKNEEYALLETKERDLSSRIEILTLEKATHEAYIREAKSTFIDTMQELKENSKSSIKELTSNSQQEFTQFMKDLKAIIQDVSNTGKLELENTASQIKDLISHLTNISEEFGRMDSLAPLFKIITKRPVSRVEGLVTLESLLQHMQNWKEIQDNSGLKNSLKTLQSQVRLHLATISA